MDAVPRYVGHLRASQIDFWQPNDSFCFYRAVLLVTAF